MMKFFTISVLVILFSCSNQNAILLEPKGQVSQVEESAERVVTTLKETDFFKEPTSFVVSKNFKSDYPVDNSFSTNDSDVLQKAIDDISSQGGGKLYIPKGNYSFSEVSLKSNVHLRIDSKAVFRPAEIPDKRNKNYTMFKVVNEKSKTPVQNVSICGVNGKFTVDLRYTKTEFLNVRIIQSFNVTNFKYTNLIVRDKFSKFSVLTFNGIKIGNRVYGPNKGLIKNIELYGSDYGYGVVQLQLAKKLLFKNLYGEGGATLRIETHNKVLRELGTYDLVDEIYGRNIRSENGNCALMLSPHFIDQGKVDVRNIKSIGSGFAVRINKGFANPEEAALGLKAGSFSDESVVKNVSATYSKTKAQIKPKHYKYMPCNLRQFIQKDPITLFPHGDSYNGPSIAAVLYNPNYKVNITDKDVSIEGFQKGLEIVTDDDMKTDNECGL
ncbi:glycoside hydrolase family protein [Flammeovirga pacifica]|nr:glycosyl hydrolase family 28-related protein [Flammeovirga pacifica]